MSGYAAVGLWCSLNPFKLAPDTLAEIILSETGRLREFSVRYHPDWVYKGSCVGKLGLQKARARNIDDARV